MSKGIMWRLILILFIAVLGGLFSSWLSPKAISWYFEPPTQMGMSCKPATEWAMQKLLIAQAAGIIGGAFIGLILSFTYKKAEKTDSNQPAKT